MNVKKLRKCTGLNQTDFWARVFVTQSGGCRYERGDRRLPKTVEALLTMAYGTLKQADRMYCIVRYTK